MIKLGLPLRDIRINQKFGVNYVDFYQQLGMKGHNGIDLEAYTGIYVNATHSGKCTMAGKDGTGGIGVEILGDGFKTISYHLKDTTVKVGQDIKQGDVIGHADNTGKYTTGDHLHFGLKLVDNDGNTLNKDNGYNGAIDPAPYFEKDWDKSNACKRYGRKRTWTSFTKNEVPVSIALTKYLKRKPTFEQINACVYGGWDRETVADNSMYQIWGWCTKDAYKRGTIPFKI